MLENAIGDARSICAMITSWENRWHQSNLLVEHPDGLSARATAILRKAEAMSPDDYRGVLLKRAVAQQHHAMVAPLADAIITLSCPGPAPLWNGDLAGQPLAPRPTGDIVFNAASSLLFAPAVTMP